MRTNVVSLLTDFGTQDNYVGVMKGVILTILPGTSLVDITHDIPRHSVEHAAFLLERSYRYFPPGTVHLVVVDPEVGGARKPIAVRADKHFFVCPDNGVMSHVLTRLEQWEAREIENKDFLLVKMSNSFHGRDLFSPVAAYLSKGVPFEKFGPRLKDPVRFPIEQPKANNGQLEGTIVYIDRYGNLISNIEESLMLSFDGDCKADVSLDGRPVSSLQTSYSDVPENTPVALLGGFGLLEVAINQGNAKEHFKADLGSTISVTR